MRIYLAAGISAVICREAAVAAQAVTELLDVLRSTAVPVAATAPAASLAGPSPATQAAVDWAWEEAAAGVAALGAAHCTACADLARGLRQMALRGGARDAGTAAVVAAYLATSPRGRAALLSEGVLPGLVGVVGNPACSAAARAAAADAIGAIAVPNSVVLDSGLDRSDLPSGSSETVGAVTQGRGATRGSASATRSGGMPGGQQQAGLAPLPNARVVDPKVEAVRAGAVAALVGLLKAGAGPVCVLEASESLYILAGCQVGRDAAVAAGARDALQVSPRCSHFAAASSTIWLWHCDGTTC